MTTLYVVIGCVVLVLVFALLYAKSQKGAGASKERIKASEAGERAQEAEDHSVRTRLGTLLDRARRRVRERKLDG